MGCNSEPGFHSALLSATSVVHPGKKKKKKIDKKRLDGKSLCNYALGGIPTCLYRVRIYIE